jgi:subtilase family serine protease
LLGNFSVANAESVLPDQAVEHIPVCPPGNPDIPRCHARVKVDRGGKVNATTSPTGLSPAQLLNAYSLSGTVTSPQTIAIVDAYDHPNIYSDLTTYSNTFGLPVLGNCAVSGGTASSPCFQKVDQRGGTSYPAVNSGWALEIALDVEAAHAICQNCNILLVEADSNSYTDLMAAVDRARLMGAKYISNSYGSGEFSIETTYDSHFNFPGTAFTFSSGDSGYGSSYPAASRYVTAVGGTTLNMSGTTYLSETVWSGSGSGCSLYESKPSWQTDTKCARRTIADVSAVADPNTGASVYDSVAYSGQTGWFQVGGTSLSAPVIAGVYALAHDLGSSQANSLPYLRANYGVNLRDITSGRNGRCRKSPYLCTASTGYDGPTGLGTPLTPLAF